MRPFASFVAGLVTAGAIPVLFALDSVYATATASTLTMSVSDRTLTASLMPGTFDDSTSTTILVNTNNFTGYTLTVKAASSNELVSSNNDTIPSMTGAPINRATYVSSGTYNNTFGFKPSKYLDTSNDTVVTNNDYYLPVPTSAGTVMDVTSAPNETNNSYTLSYGVKVSANQPAGTYIYEYIISAVGNESVYNITYSDNAGGYTVTNMPVDNPQAISVDAGTPAEDSYGVLSSNVPARTGYTFAGWCDETTTVDSLTGNQVCTGTTYQPGDHYEIDQTSSLTNITLYAIWLDGTFPVVWNQMGKCIFDGDALHNSGLISGSECTAYSTKRFIDTGIALYSNDNYGKDYEVHFTIDRYVGSEQPETQSTMFNDKLSSSVTGSPYDGHSPGIVVRQNGSSSFEVKSTYTTEPVHGQRSVHKSDFAGTDVRIFRINGVIYTSIDNGPLVVLQDMRDPAFAQQFGLTAWFGAYPDNVNCTENCTAAKRYFEGELSDMYIRLGDFDESSLYEVTFYGNEGTPATTEYLILDGDEAPFPTVTRTDWVFAGWYTAANGGTQVTEPFVPEDDEDLYAHWVKAVSQAQITNSSISLSIHDTETINITNASLLEPYTFVSSDSTVATVDPSTGEVTGVSGGTATITMTGTITGDTQTITVTVSGTIDVTFDPDHDSEPTITVNVADGGTIADADIPHPTRSGYTLEGWYTGHDGTGTQLTTSTVFDSNTPTTYYAHWEEVVLVCKLATELHTETCQRTGTNAGCRKAGYDLNETITYGNIVESVTMHYGDAYDCDIDKDGLYGEKVNGKYTERFYYIGANNNIASFVYYKDEPAGTNLQFDAASAALPDSSVWTNDNLETIGSKVSRFMTVDEVVALCGGTATGNNNVGQKITGTTKGNCGYIAENSRFAYQSQDGWLNTIWLQRVNNVNKRVNLDDGLAIQTPSLVNTANGPRPVIEVSLDLVEKYVPAQVTEYTVTFNPNGGTFSDPSDATKSVNDGSAVGALPTPTKSGNMFFGWYKDDGTFYDEVYPEEIIDSDVTYYARWIENDSSFPIVFAEINACEFRGSSGYVTGYYCAKDEVSNTAINKSKAYIDTGVSLYTAANYDLDYEIGFTIVSYDFSARQMTLAVGKWENDAAKWPGFAIRRYDETSNLEFTHSMGGNKATTQNQIPAATVKRVKFVRQNGVIKYSVNDGALTTLQDLNNLTEQDFDYTVWFGASATEAYGAQRKFAGILTDMYVKLENKYTITFDAGAGSVSEASRRITAGSPVGNLPMPTPPSSSYTFGGWYNEQNVLVSNGAQYYPTASETLTAKWDYQSSDTPVAFNIANNALRGYQTLVDSWTAGSIDITTFNKTSPINSSTWGDTTELSETQFWSELRNNFTTNDCMVPSYGDATATSVNTPAWTSGSIDCSKPEAYDTEIGASVDVYLYDLDTSTLGAQVAYAKASNGVIHNMIPGQTYKWAKSDDSTVYGYVTATSTKGRRFVDMGTIRNARDLGGLSVTYTDNNNQTVTDTLEYGRLFRGEKLWNESASELTDLGITTEYDVGNPADYSGNTKLNDYVNDEVIHYNFDYNSGDENNSSSNYMRAWNAVTDIMTDIVANKNIYFHCRVGADRTGTVAYLLEGLLGVSDEDRYEEYALTHLSGLYDRTRYYKEKVGGSTNPTYKFVYMMDYVLTKQDIYNWYMKNPNASASLIQSFRTAMTTPAATPSNQNSTPPNMNTNSLQSFGNLQSVNNVSETASGDNTSENETTNESNVSGVEDNGGEDSDSENSYGDPLGVSTTADGSSRNVTTDNTAAVAAAAIAAMSAVTIGGVVYSLAKQHED